MEWEFIEEQKRNCFSQSKDYKKRRKGDLIIIWCQSTDKLIQVTSKNVEMLLREIQDNRHITKVTYSKL